MWKKIINIIIGIIDSLVIVYIINRLYFQFSQMDLILIVSIEFILWAISFIIIVLLCAKANNYKFDFVMLIIVILLYIYYLC